MHKNKVALMVIAVVVILAAVGIWALVRRAGYDKASQTPVVTPIPSDNAPQPSPEPTPDTQSTLPPAVPSSMDGGTALTFSDASALPTTYKPDAAQDYNFSVRNTTASDMTYTYSIKQQAGVSRLSILLKQGSFRVAAGQAHSEHVSVVPHDVGDTTQFVTTIEYPSGAAAGSDDAHQTISYWAAKTDH